MNPSDYGIPTVGQVHEAFRAEALRREGLPGPMASQRRDSNGLTCGQRCVLALVVWARVEGSPPPTVREVCRVMGWAATNYGLEVFNRLQALGFVERAATLTPRTIVPTHAGFEALGAKRVPGIYDPRVATPALCVRCGAVTFKPHRVGTCSALWGAKA